MVGSFAVGKTSLVSRFVYHAFSEKYLATVGVRIDRKSIRLGERDVVLMVWDLAGQEESDWIRTTYTRGSSGHLLVADGTRPETVDEAVRIQQELASDLGPLPFVLVVNKTDLTDQWRVTNEAMEDLQAKGWHCVLTSAKTGDGVEAAFHALAASIVAERDSDEG